MTTSTLLLPALADKSGLLQAFAAHCRFTDGFGYNWDALWDSLNDWLEQQPMPLCLIIDGSQVQQLDSTDWQQCLQILSEARDSWPGFSYQLQQLPDCTNTRGCNPVGQYRQPKPAD